MEYSDQSCREALRTADSNVDGKLTAKEYRETVPPGPSQSYLERKYGSWNKAKEEFGLDQWDAGSTKNPGKLPVNAEYFKRIDTPEKAYFYGLIIADGSLTKYNFHLTLVDEKLVKKFKQAIESEHKIREKELDGRQNQYALNIGRNDFCKHLFDRGVDNKTFSGTTPDLPDKLFRHWVRGLCDGDGYIGWGEGTPVITITGSEKRLKRVSLRVPADGSVRDAGSAWRLIMYGENARTFADYIYPEGRNTEPKLDRKHPKWN
jgi:hypothetical protein